MIKPDTIIEDLQKAKEKNATIEEIDFIIQNSYDCYGKTGRYDIAKTIFEDKPKIWKEIYKLSVKKSCTIHMKIYNKNDSTSKELIACNFHTLHYNINNKEIPTKYKFNVFDYISSLIGEEIFKDIMENLPQFITNPK